MNLSESYFGRFWLARTRMTSAIWRIYRFKLKRVLTCQWVSYCSSNKHTSFPPDPHRSFLRYFPEFLDIRRSNNHKSVFHMIIESYLPHNFSDRPRSWTLWIRQRGFSNDNYRIYVGLVRLLLCSSEKLFFCSSSTIHTASCYTSHICSEIAFIVS